MTLGDYFRIRYNRQTELLLSICIIVSYLGWVSAQITALGLTFNVLSNDLISTHQGMLIGAGVVLIYTLFGGMWSVALTTFVQMIVIVIGLLLVTQNAADQAGGIAQVFAKAAAEGKFEWLPSMDALDILGWAAALMTMALGSIPQQDVFQRVMSSGSERTAIRSCFYAAGLYLTVAMLPLFISLCTKHLYPDQLTGDLQLSLPRMVLAHMPLWVQVVFFGSLLSAIMSTTSSAILAPAAILSENIIKPVFREKISDKKLLLITRVSVLLFSAIATVMATTRNNIYELVGESSVVSLVSLFIPLTLGLYWPSSTGKGAIAGMFTGILSWFLFKWVDTGVPELVPATLISLVTMVAVSIYQRNKTSI